MASFSAIFPLKILTIKEQNKQIIGYDINGNPITASEAKTQYDKDLAKVKNSSYSYLKDVREKYKQ